MGEYSEIQTEKYLTGWRQSRKEMLKQSASSVRPNFLRMPELLALRAPQTLRNRNHVSKGISNKTGRHKKRMATIGIRRWRSKTQKRKPDSPACSRSFALSPKCSSPCSYHLHNGSRRQTQTFAHDHIWVSVRLGVEFMLARNRV